MTINPELIPRGMEVVKEVTPHCFVNAAGEVVFLRKRNGEWGPVVFSNIYDAISQCFHILDNVLGEMVDFYRRQPKVFGSGEMDEMRDIAKDLQGMINLIVSAGVQPSEQSRSAQVTLRQIVRRLGAVRNVHKRLLLGHLQKVSEVRDGRGLRPLGEALGPTMAHLETIRRFDELDNIARGVIVQAKCLIGICAIAEWRIKEVYGRLSVYGAAAHGIVKKIEVCERQQGSQPVEEYLGRLQVISAEISGGRSNKVTNALKGVVLVKPFKPRLESPDVKRLERLDEYLQAWASGNSRALLTFCRAIDGARAKLKRVAREQKSPAERRTLERQYQSRL